MRLDNKQSAAADLADAAQFSSFGNFSDTKDAEVRRPEVLFVLAPDEALEVQAPCDVLRLCEIQSGKRDADSSGPPRGGYLRFRGPHTIPTGIEVLTLRAVLFSDQTICLGAQRVELEDICIPPVVRGIDQDRSSRQAVAVNRGAAR